MLQLTRAVDEREATWVALMGTEEKNVMRVGERYHQALAMCRALFSEKDYPQGHLGLVDALWWSGRWDVNWNLDEFENGKPKESPVADRGKRDCLRSVAMLEKLYPKNEYPDGHPLLAERLSEMGALLAELSEYDSAVEFARRGVEMSEKVYPRDRFPNGHPALVRALYNVGMIRVQGLLAGRH